MNSPSFRRLMREVKEEKIFIPYIRAALSNPDFKRFSIEVEGWQTREYDGWFHPSTHATWTARQLALYMSKGQNLPPPPVDLMFVCSVTQGKLWHEFIQGLCLDAGLLLENPGTSKKTHTVTERAEISLVDPSHNRRGHADGRRKDELWEFKTASERVIAKLESAEDLKKYKPGYYAQTQDYLDISGYPAMRYFVMQLSAPFAMAEFLVPADKEFQAAQRTKYREAIDTVSAGDLPDACCGIGSKEAKACPVRLLCPIGRIER